MNMPHTPVLGRLLDPLAQSLTRDSARNLLELRADPVAQARVNELADKCNEGQLSDEERVEYESYVLAGDIITILQSKARQLLSAS